MIQLAGNTPADQGGICFAVSSAVLSAVVARSVAAAENAAAAGPASSCGVARNATTTCLGARYAVKLGLSIVDANSKCTRLR